MTKTPETLHDLTPEQRKVVARMRALFSYATTLGDDPDDVKSIVCAVVAADTDDASWAEISERVMQHLNWQAKV